MPTCTPEPAPPIADRSVLPVCHHLRHQKVPITLQHCHIQQNSKFEVVLKGNTKIEQSSAHFEILDLNVVGSPLTPLSDLNQKEEYDKISIQAKVIKCHDPQKCEYRENKTRCCSSQCYW